MNKNQAKKLAATVTEDEFLQMFENAKNSITDWSRISRVNKSFTIGATWNIFYPSRMTYVKNGVGNFLARKNAIWEFGEYLPIIQDNIIEKKEKIFTKPHHQQPIF